MPPALVKMLEKDCRMHISSPVLTQDMDSIQDIESQIKVMDDSYDQFWFYISSLPVLDPSYMKNSLQVPELAQQSPILNTNVLKGHQDLTQTSSHLHVYQTESKSLSSVRSNGIRNDAFRPVCQSTSHGMAQDVMDSWRMQLASQQHILATRVDQAKLRLHALLGENALHTFTKQVEEMKRKLLLMSAKPEPNPLVPAEKKGTNGAFRNSSEDSSVEKISERLQLIRGIQSLVQDGQAVLHESQRALDSDATESSSDDEWEEETRGKRATSGCLGCEWRFQCDRAKLATQWTWLKLRLSDLDFQIQQVSQLHQHLTANKGGVVLSKAQPLTVLQIQQTLLTETGLTLTAGHTHDLNSELDTEPSSPSHLIRNIERQSAQLSQIVNSLMAPVSDSPSRSPVAKGHSRCWRGSKKRLFNSCVADVCLHNDSTCIHKTVQKKRRMDHQCHCHSQMDVPQVCARTRPLLCYHKPHLFFMGQSPTTKQRAKSSAHKYSTSVSYFFKENWLNQSRFIIPSPSFTTAEKHESSIFNCTHALQTAQTHSEATLTQDMPAQTCRQTVQRQHKLQADIDMYMPASSEDSTGVMLTPHHTNILQTKSQFSVPRRNGESIPVSLAASTTVEKLQYKDIPTPSWRVLEFSPLVKKEVEEEDIDKVECLSDEVFIQRHQSYEHREKLCWSSWEKGKKSTHRTRFSSITDVSCDCESWTCSTRQDTKERQLQPPWERRVFPLSKTDEETLRYDRDATKSEDGLWLKNKEMESSLSGSRCKNSVPSVCYTHTAPPAGCTRNNKCSVINTGSHQSVRKPLTCAL